MNFKILLAFTLAAAASAAVIPVVPVAQAEPETQDEPVNAEKSSSRRGRTLGLLTVGAQSIGEGLGAVGTAAVTAAGTVAAVKPLVLLGLGKYALWNYINRPGQNVGLSASYKAPNFPLHPTSTVTNVGAPVYASSAGANSLIGINANAGLGAGGFGANAGFDVAGFGANAGFKLGVPAFGANAGPVIVGSSTPVISQNPTFFSPAATTSFIGDGSSGTVVGGGSSSFSSDFDNTQFVTAADGGW